MNVVFAIISIVSIVLLLLTSPESIVPTMIDGVGNGMRLILSLLSIYGIWMSILAITEKIGVERRLGRLMRPLTRRLFKGEDDKTLDIIASNFSTNMLGMGGAATPLGIKAIERMQGDSDIATDNSILFVVINATSIQILPMTIIGLRASNGASSPSDIILPSLISTTVATAVGILLSKVLHE